jgi:hypothetical protein
MPRFGELRPYSAIGLRRTRYFEINAAFADIVGVNDGESAEEKAMDIRRCEDLEKVSSAKDGCEQDCKDSEAHTRGGSKQGGDRADFAQHALAFTLEATANRRWRRMRASLSWNP